MTAAETYTLAFDFGPIEVPRLMDRRVAAGEFHARFVGEPVQAYVIQRSADLRSWAPILTNSTSAQGMFDFSDTSGAGSLDRFYRAVESP